MTLIVSLRIPDGIVIAGDSLLTVKEKDQPVPATYSHAHKIFPFCGKYGVGIFGAGLVANESVSVAMRIFEQDLKDEQMSFDGVSKFAQKMSNYFHNILKEQFEKQNKSLDTLQPRQFVYGFHVVGYDGTHPKTFEIQIGKTVQSQAREEEGCTFTGSGEIVQKIWELYRTHPENQPLYPFFSLQEAIDYAEFLIQTTITHQRFSRKIPNVGGDIDIGIVTYLDGFRWIRQKPLNHILKGS